MNVNPEIIKALKNELKEVLDKYNARLQGDYDGDIDLRVDNRYIGYWCGSVTEEDWTDLTK